MPSPNGYKILTAHSKVKTKEKQPVRYCIRNVCISFRISGVPFFRAVGVCACELSSAFSRTKDCVICRNSVNAGTYTTLATKTAGHDVVSQSTTI